jgi:hypothetical protein
MALKIGSKTKVYRPLWAEDIIPRISGNLIVKYAQKEYKVIGYHDLPNRLYLQDPQEPDCELIVEMDKVKPLLRKMDSMTSEEKEYYQSLLDGVADQTKEVWEVTEWLNRKMFDYKDLISQGLAEEE